MTDILGLENNNRKEDMRVTVALPTNNTGAQFIQQSTNDLVLLWCLVALDNAAIQVSTQGIFYLLLTSKSTSI